MQRAATGYGAHCKGTCTALSLSARKCTLNTLHFSLCTFRFIRGVKPFGSVLFPTRVRTQYIYNEKGGDKGLSGWRKEIPFGSVYAAMHEAA